MKPLTGGLIGAALTAVAVFGWTGRTGAREDAAWPAATTAPSAVHLVSSTAQPGVVQPALGVTSEAAANAPVAVTCEPGQRAVLRQVAGPLGVVNEAACVTDPRGFSATPVGFVSQDVIDPAAVRPARYVTREAAPERVVYRERPARRATSTRSWQKRALVIGGSAGAGAGIGALAGGKKGALIGAAVGGGAGTVYELLRK
jgi:hypothetical protein